MAEIGNFNKEEKGRMELMGLVIPIGLVMGVSAICLAPRKFRVAVVVGTIGIIMMLAGFIGEIISANMR